jgi:hypothetical protein
VDATHKTCRSFLDIKKDAYLFSIVVRHPSAVKGVPVCFMVTSHEFSKVVKDWFDWIKACIAQLNVNLRTIMIDCSAIEMRAIRDSFGQSVDILLCHWHIKRAWEKRIKSDVRARISTFLFSLLDECGFFHCNGTPLILFTIDQGPQFYPRISSDEISCPLHAEYSHVQQHGGRI